MRPGLEFVEACEDFGDGPEAGVEDVVLARRHRRLFDVAEMDDAEMHLADGRFIVVDQSGDRLGVRRVDRHFFGQFAAHALAVDVFHVAGGRVERRDVPADADAPLGVEPAFAHAAAALVLEELRLAVVVDPAEEDVGNQLLVAGVVFHPPAGQILDLAAFQEPRQVAAHLGREALEVAQLSEQRRWERRALFRWRRRTRRILSGARGTIVSRFARF